MSDEQIINEPVPTIMTEAIKVIHPIFRDPDSGQMLPPPPDHEYRVGIQVSVGLKGNVVTEVPSMYFISGSDIDEIAGGAAEVVTQILKSVEEQTRQVKVASSGTLHQLDKMRGTTPKPGAP